MIGDKIKEAIENSGIPIKVVATLLDLSEQGLHRLFKRDSVETKYLILLSKNLKIPVNFFFEKDLPVSHDAILERQLMLLKAKVHGYKFRNKLYKSHLKSLRKQLEEASKKLY